MHIDVRYDKIKKKWTFLRDTSLSKFQINHFVVCGFCVRELRCIWILGFLRKFLYYCCNSPNPMVKVSLRLWVYSYVLWENY